jgi:large subunit ribosomal protein L29
LGFLASRALLPPSVVPGEREILNLAVDPSARRLGVWPLQSCRSEPSSWRARNPNMKKNDFKELRGLTVAELQQKARDTKAELFNLRFALRTGHLTDFSKVREMRRAYAQIQTVISEKRMAQEQHGAA